MTWTDFFRWLGALFSRGSTYRAPDGVFPDPAAPSDPAFKPYDTPAPVSAPTAPVAARPGETLITPALLRELGVGAPEMWAPILNKHMQPAGILANHNRIANFLANTLNETGGFKRLVESLDYTPDRMAVVWPRRYATNPDSTARKIPNQQALDIGRIEHLGRVVREANQSAIAEASYGGRYGNTMPGDAFKYRGRGLMQTTFKDNYAAAARWSRLPLLERPELLEQPDAAVQSAVCFWASHGCNEVADRGDIKGVRKIINGGEIGLDDVRIWHARVLRALAAIPL